MWVETGANVWLFCMNWSGSLTALASGDCSLIVFAIISVDTCGPTSDNAIEQFSNVPCLMDIPIKKRTFLLSKIFTFMSNNLHSNKTETVDKHCRYVFISLSRKLKYSGLSSFSNGSKIELTTLALSKLTLYAFPRTLKSFNKAVICSNEIQQMRKMRIVKEEKK